jgi:ABC-type transport system involved in multi-copper enzyme maturation permease subunit
MRNTTRKLRAAVMLELDMSFSFPVLECLVALPILLASLSVLQYIPGVGTTSEAVPELFNREKLFERMVGLGAYVFATNLYTFDYVVLFIVPMAVTFTLARGFENGTTRTMLSYPIGRRSFLLTRAGLIVLTTALPINAGRLFPVIVFTPPPIDVAALMTMSVSLWVLVFAICTTTVLVAVISGSMPTTAVIGCGLWFIMLYEAMAGSLSSVVRGVLNPVLIAISLEGEGATFPFFEGVTASDVATSLLAAFVIGVFSLLTAVAWFNRRGL